MAYYHSRRGRAVGHGAIKLTPAREFILVSVAQAVSVNSVALSVQLIRDLIQPKFDVTVSDHCVTRIVRRHRRELSKRVCKALSDKRVVREVFDEEADFCTELAIFRSYYHFSDFAVLIYDETRVVQRGGKVSLLRVDAYDKLMANVRSTRHCTAASLLTFFSADRGVLMSAHSLKGRFGDGKEAAVNYTMEKVEARTQGTLSWSYCWNSTGYLDADAFKAVQAKAGEEWSTRKTGINAVQFSDQLAARRRADIVEFAMTLKLFISSPAPKNSHTIQLLDEVSFGALQSGNTRRNEEAVMDAVLTNTDSRDTLLLSAYAA